MQKTDRPCGRVTLVSRDLAEARRYSASPAACRRGQNLRVSRESVKLSETRSGDPWPLDRAYLIAEPKSYVTSPCDQGYTSCLPALIGAPTDAVLARSISFAPFQHSIPVESRRKRSRNGSDNGPCIFPGSSSACKAGFCREYREGPVTGSPLSFACRTYGSAKENAIAWFPFIQFRRQGRSDSQKHR
jgi:hypothetical protein